ncbi:alpha-N-acetylneuraminide alpha-2,8-sialyltransferase-like isoform X1 [Branchiostoma lanceolatum]|uniref:alpha-N-acetylneuraminide alpha-2,8-sialyltransferase-like isoform X1 n=2 Tax=Branchiostoma lanceolatum TaxID=7740 RepID=UPI0034533A4A
MRLAVSRRPLVYCIFLLVAVYLTGLNCIYNQTGLFRYGKSDDCSLFKEGDCVCDCEEPNAGHSEPPTRATQQSVGPEGLVQDSVADSEKQWQPCRTEEKFEAPIHWRGDEKPVLVFEHDGKTKNKTWSTSLMMVTESYNLVGVKQPFYRPWSSNKENVDRFRRHLKDCCDAQKGMILTKENGVLEYDYEFPKLIDNEVKLKLSEEFYDEFPQKTPIPEKRYGRCAVVGNGGILKGSECGKDIDSHDFVFRINLPPLGKKPSYDRHVGVKVNLTSTTTAMIRKYRPVLQDPQMLDKFLNETSVYRGLLVVKRPFDYVVALQKGLEKNLTQLKIVYQNPVHYLDVSWFWSKQGLPGVISTGLYQVTNTIMLCDEVTLYGFWPFPINERGAKVGFHYHNAPIFIGPAAGMESVYDMGKEFMMIRKLHTMGVVRVVLDKCEKSGEE